MRRAWIGVAFLAASWMAVLGYYHQPDWIAGTPLAAAGVLLLGAVIRVPQGVSLGSQPAMVPTPWQAVAGIVVLAPALAAAPWPYKLPPALMVAGLAGLAVVGWQEERSRPADRVLHWLAGGLLAAGAVLLVQALAITGYEGFTARNLELPRPVAEMLARLAGWAGIKTAVDGNNNIVMYAFRQPQRLGATWALLFDPATLGFLVGGLMVPAIQAWQAGRSIWVQRRALLVFALCVLGWLPVRAVLLMAIYMHRVLRTEYDAPIDLMDQFWSVWVHLLLLAGPVVLAMVLVRVRSPRNEVGKVTGIVAPNLSGVRKAGAVALAALGVAALALAVFWNPVGARKPGRVLVDEYHSQWEDTRRPFDTKWYGHLSTYQYAAIYDYCTRFYEMGRIEAPITGRTLADCDVLIAKLPTRPYGQEELWAIRDFVRAGGGLLLIGEHTNVFATGENLNQLARYFGFSFRYDCLFDIDSVFQQAYRPAVVPHPIAQHLPRTDGRGTLDFVVSCSIDPGYSPGRAAIRSIGLTNLPIDYYASNFYPQVNNQPYMRYGAFEQVWTTEYGRGRVAAFGDSTMFSNFCAFEPGKSELFLGMIEWLNHRDAPDSRWLLAAGGMFVVLLSLAAGRGWSGGWVVMLAGGVLGWAGAAAYANIAQARAMPAPQAVRPMVKVVMDRTVSGGKLPKGGFIAGEEDGFGIFEMWILRLGYFTSRRSGAEAFDGDVLVFAYPNRPVSDEFREGLAKYVEGGGRVLVIDSMENKGSTANALLRPFKLTVERNAESSGILTTPAGWPTTAVTGACQVAGGEPLITLEGKPVAASARHGKGKVTVIGFGTRFSDLNMGVTADVEPKEELLAVFELEYALVRGIVEEGER